MDKISIALAIFALGLVACDGSGTSSTEQNSESELESSGSNSAGVDCLALMEGYTDWNRDVPKECRLNPEINYGNMTDARDGKIYKTVKIGEQTWMAENLNYADSAKTASLKGKSWCYNNADKNCDVTGRLYTWAAAIDSVKLATDVDHPQKCGRLEECGLAFDSDGSATLIQGICPSGWHLPSPNEWKAFFMAVGGESTAGKFLKSQTGWMWEYSNGNYSDGNGTDTFGFSALPAGERNEDGYFENEGYYAKFWSSFEDLSLDAYFVKLYYNRESVRLNSTDKYSALSVRCVKD